MRPKSLGIVVGALLAGCAYTMTTPDRPPVDCSQNLAHLQQWLDKHVAKEMGRKLPIRKRDLAVISAATAGDLVLYVGATSLYISASLATAVADDNHREMARAARAGFEKIMEKASEMPLENQAYAYVFNSRAFERDRFAKKWRALADCHFDSQDFPNAIRVYEDIIVNAESLQVRPLMGMKSLYGNLAEAYAKLGMTTESDVYRTRQAGEP